MRDQEEMDKHEKQRRLQVIVQGADSEYWKLLSEKVSEWILYEERYQDSFKKKGMNQRYIGEYNRSIDQAYFMRKFILINDELIADYKTLLDKAKDYVSSFWDKKFTFVGKK